MHLFICSRAHSARRERHRRREVDFVSLDISARRVLAVKKAAGRVLPAMRALRAALRRPAVVLVAEFARLGTLRRPVRLVAFRAAPGCIRVSQVRARASWS